ncbi:secretion protein HylD [Agrobacterium vitis]|uniref:secretion protein HylD n=1 Tax=Agrobacterium vitis TaxID=373 RepID=UPI0012E77B69|nr:secretion protein HylD [Agrobacterium vitis]MCE6073374.1 secretion protein HylD [Agrobacterium vitis]MVA17405.1 secretion protein HylD [Agrobacterium vitis]MVA91630.1 secretion protein HylD [Agrobacterium vitis]MVB00466.1 secretion protein HylD [Agrobacterium vitis]
MTIALTILKAIGWRGLVLIGALAALFAWHLHGISAAKESGRIEVRQQWAEAQRRADLKQIAKVEAQQKQINAADAALVTTIAAHVGQVAGLEAALADERKRKNAKPNAAGSSACPAISDGGMPDGVRNALNAIGATKP